MDPRGRKDPQPSQGEVPTGLSEPAPKPPGWDTAGPGDHSAAEPPHGWWDQSGIRAVFLRCEVRQQAFLTAQVTGAPEKSLYAVGAKLGIWGGGEPGLL